MGPHSNVKLLRFAMKGYVAGILLTCDHRPSHIAETVLRVKAKNTATGIRGAKHFPSLSCNHIKKVELGSDRSTQRLNVMRSRAMSRKVSAIGTGDIKPSIGRLCNKPRRGNIG